MNHVSEQLISRCSKDQNLLLCSIHFHIEVKTKVFPRDAINNNSAMLQIMAWCRANDKPSSLPMMAYVTDAFTGMHNSVSMTLFYLGKYIVVAWGTYFIKMILPNYLSVVFLDCIFAICSLLNLRVIILNKSWWHHGMETFSAFLAFLMRNDLS